MKKEFNTKSAEALNSIVHGTKDFSKKAADSARTGIGLVIEKSKNDSYARKLKKYNPVFPSQFESDSFNIPNMIKIVDDAVRKGIDVCEGSIGWLGKESGIEVLYLYDEAIDFSKLQFVPSATCDTVYYVDSFDRKRFIRTDCIFSKAHEERIAELKHIAYSLGAKKCTIEISESLNNNSQQKRNVGFQEMYTNASGSEYAEQSIHSSSISQRSGKVEAIFQGNVAPQMPRLKWFAHDDNINRLIEMCCNGNMGVISETLELSGSSSATMSQSTACAIDGAIGKLGGAKSHISMDSQASKEHHSKLLFHIEF